MRLTIQSRAKPLIRQNGRDSIVTMNQKIWIGQSGQRYGPYSEAEILQWLIEGKVNAETLAWQNKQVGWIALSTMFPEKKNESPPPPPNAVAPFPVELGSYGDFRKTNISSASSNPQNTLVKSTDSARVALPTPPSLHWGLVLLFTILTFGIFAIIWPFIQANWVKKIDRSSSATLLLAIALICVVAGETLYFINMSSITQLKPNLSIAVGGVLLLASWLLNLVAYFSISGSMRRNTIAYGLKLDIGGVTLLFFTMYYLQAQMTWLAHWKNTGQVWPKASKEVFWAFLVIPFVVAICAAIAIPAYQTNAKGKFGAGEAQLITLNQKIENYELDNSSPPQQLKDLLIKPANAKNWQGPYANEADLIDPYGNAYNYQSPGKHGSFDLIFLGQDGKPGGTGYNRDVGNWQ
jgi:type II secretion system protein G